MMFSTYKSSIRLGSRIIDIILTSIAISWVQMDELANQCKTNVQQAAWRCVFKENKNWQSVDEHCASILSSGQYKRGEVNFQCPISHSPSQVSSTSIKNFLRLPDLVYSGIDRFSTFLLQRSFTWLSVVQCQHFHPACVGDQCLALDRCERGRD